METRQVSDVEREMRALIEEHRASGQSLAQFADSRGVPRWKLYDWRRKIEERDVRALSRERFAPVRIADTTPPVDSESEPVAGGSSIEVVLRGGRTVVLRGDVDGERLQRVVRALEAC